MKTIQEIFDTVIAEEFYASEDSPNPLSSPYMCFSLDCAERKGAITKKEMKKAQKAIAIYLKEDTGCECTEDLEIILIGFNLPSDFPARLKIYQDWENRPELFLYD